MLDNLKPNFSYILLSNPVTPHIFGKILHINFSYNHHFNLNIADPLFVYSS